MLFVRISSASILHDPLMFNEKISRLLINEGCFYYFSQK